VRRSNLTGRVLSSPQLLGSTRNDNGGGGSDRNPRWPIEIAAVTTTR